jgi:hypothetical protein
MTQDQINQLPIAYLVEATSVTTTGNLQGKSLRCYEVHYDTAAKTRWGTEIKIYPTGKMYVLKDGEIKCKPTKATLSNKYLGWQSVEVHTSVDKGIKYYGSSLFSSPDLAIIAKTIAIKARVNEVKTDIQKQLDKINKTEASLEDTSALEASHPEYFI